MSFPAFDPHDLEAPAERSLAWHCSTCGRLHLEPDLRPRPAHCSDCGGAVLTMAGPATSPRLAFGREPGDA